MSTPRDTPRPPGGSAVAPRRVVAADVGGTRVRLAVATVEEERCRFERRATLASREQDGLDRALGDFLRSLDEPVEAACVAVAGPVVGGHARLPNLPWDVDESRLRESTGLTRLRLVNDFDAAARGLPLLREDEQVVLQEGAARPEGTQALIGAGTGLGMAFVTRAADGSPVVHSSEGGHAPFAASDPLDAALAEFLRERHGAVSWERVVSGPGLVAIHEFLVASGRATCEEALAQALREPEAAAAVTRAARSGDPGAALALETFLRAYARAASSLALTVQAEGGVWIGGGIAPRLLEELRRGAFVESFRDVGPLRHLVERMPLRVVTAAELGLVGAAALAAELV